MEPFPPPLVDKPSGKHLQELLGQGVRPQVIGPAQAKGGKGQVGKGARAGQSREWDGPAARHAQFLRDVISAKAHG